MRQNITIPQDVSSELASTLRAIRDAIERPDPITNWNLNKHRITNGGDAVNANDYVTLRQLDKRASSGSLGMGSTKKWQAAIPSGPVFPAYIQNTWVLYAKNNQIAAGDAFIYDDASNSLTVQTSVSVEKETSNSHYFRISATSSNIDLDTAKTGTGLLRPMRFLVDGDVKGYMATNGGLVWGEPTGDTKGVGTINAVGVYDDNVLLTDYVFDPEYRVMPLEGAIAFTQKHHHLPTIPTFLPDNKPSIGERSNFITEAIECNFLYIASLHERISELEAAIKEIKA